METTTSHRLRQTGSGSALCFALALLAAPLPANAQSIVISYSPAGFFTPPVTQSWNAASGQLQWSQPGIVEGTPVFTADGRYLVSYTTSATGVRSTRVLDIASLATLDLPIDFEPRLAHPRRVEVFGLTAFTYTAYGKMGTVARLDASGLTLIAGCMPGTTRHLDLTADGARLLTLCDSGDLIVIDSATGLVQRTVSVGVTQAFRGMQANHDGSMALVPQQGPSGTTFLALIDATTGATVATTVFPASDQAQVCGSGVLVGASPDRRTAVATCFYGTRLLDIDSLTWGAELSVAYLPVLVGISPDNRTAYTRSIFSGGFSSALQTIDIPTSTTTGFFAGMTFSIAAAFPPLAPALSVTTTGSRVDLQWTLPVHSPAATRYVLEAGTATGLTDIGTLTLGAGQTVSLPAVPPGTYMVRVRAGNATGVGAASNEVAITVP